MGPQPLGLTRRLPSPTSLRRPLIILTLPFLLFTSVLLFEQGRWLWHRQRRLKELQARWSESDSIQLDDLDTDEGLEPANPDETRQAVAITRGGGGYMKRIYTSLSFAGRFVNPFWEWRDKNATNVWEYLRWQLTRKNRNGVPGDEVLAQTLPVTTPDFHLLNTFHTLPPPSDSTTPHMTVTWFGQSTCLVQMDGYNILTDPIFSTRTIGSWFGPKRLRPPPCKLSELPRVDIVLVSHDHYDHLDRAVVKELGNSVTWYVPLGLRGWFNGHGVTNVIELDWWQEHTHTSVSPTQPTLLIASTPTQHWSGRHFFDVNRSLWSSFIVKGPRESLFHCGDTGYCGVFKEIGRKYGEVGLALLPIGAYEPRHVLHHQHISPSEALQIHTEINATHTVGVHWGTFMMSDEHYLDPPKVLEEGRRERGLRVGSVGVVGLGRTVRVGGGMFCADVPAEQSIPS